jgi:hypothetical protein
MKTHRWKRLEEVEELDVVCNDTYIQMSMIFMYNMYEIEKMANECIFKKLTEGQK